MEHMLRIQQLKQTRKYLQAGEIAVEVRYPSALRDKVLEGRDPQRHSSLLRSKVSLNTSTSKKVHATHERAAIVSLS